MTLQAATGALPGRSARSPSPDTPSLDSKAPAAVELLVTSSALAPHAGAWMLDVVLSEQQVLRRHLVLACAAASWPSCAMPEHEDRKMHFHGIIN